MIGYFKKFYLIINILFENLKILIEIHFVFQIYLNLNYIHFIIYKKSLLYFSSCYILHLLISEKNIQLNFSYYNKT